MPVGPREIEDARQLGIDLVGSEAGALEILEPNWMSAAAFLECRTQWRIASSLGGIHWVGLDYPAVKLVLEDLGCRPGAFADIRFMEAAALEILNAPEE